MNLLFDLADLLPWIIVGVTVGAVVGAIPGLSGAMVIALTVPLTFAMEESAAFALLVSLYTGSVGGGLVSAAILRIPGTPAAMITTLDAYPMTQAGQGGRALRIGTIASCSGGLLSGLVLLCLARPMAEWSVTLGPFQLFTLTGMALVFIVSVAEPGWRGLGRGMFAGTVGCMAALPGMHPATGEIRYTFGLSELDGGFSLLPVLIGLFAFGQAFADLFSRGAGTAGAAGDRSTPRQKGAIRENAGLWVRQLGNLTRSSVAGTFVGILPGIGANVGSTVAYGIARQFSRSPEKFGKGSEEGLIASESANNATVGGALVPLVSLGIPGSVVDAILLGAFVIHGLQPGPLLFQNHPETVEALIGAYLISNLVLAAVMLFLARGFIQIARLRKAVLAPVIITLCLVGSFSINSRMFDVVSMIGFGVLGLVFLRYRIPAAPFVIGFVLMPILEENLGAGLMISDGSFLPLLKSPFCLTCLILSLILLCSSLFRNRRDRAHQGG